MTGVQTCALPIYNAWELSLRVSPLPLDAQRRVSRLMLKTQNILSNDDKWILKAQDIKEVTEPKSITSQSIRSFPRITCRSLQKNKRVLSNDDKWILTAQDIKEVNESKSLTSQRIRSFTNITCRSLQKFLKWWRMNSDGSRHQGSQRVEKSHKSKN